MRRTPILAVAATATTILAMSACGGGGGFSSGSATQNTKTGPVKLTVMIGSSGDAETTAVKAATTCCSCSVECAAQTEQRSRAVPLGVAGGRARFT